MDARQAVNQNPTGEPAFFFAGPSQTLLAVDSGEAVVGIARERGQLLRSVERVLRERDRSSVLVGAVPFSDEAPVRLFCPNQVTRAGRWGASETAAAPRREIGLEANAVGRPLGPEEKHFVAAVADATRAIREGSLEKVVLSRAMNVELGAPPALAPLLRLLRTRNPHGFTFALGLGARSGGGAKVTLVGASPELLLSRRGLRVV
ncbi:MAG: chorismate-binding protein, partial [Myxococcota bacterium]|nr:chorismate-binding protein [Myxococcota bacterium]